MPKMKTRKSVSKRFSITKKGKISMKRATHGHFLSKKSPLKKQKLRRSGYVHPSDEKRIKIMLGV